MTFEKYIIVTNDEKEYYKVTGTFKPISELPKAVKDGWDIEEDAQFALTIIRKDWEQELIYEQKLFNEMTGKLIKNRLTKIETNVEKLRTAKVIKVKSTYEIVR